MLEKAMNHIAMQLFYIVATVAIVAFLLKPYVSI
ncbi:MAG: hypothetical protein ACI81I_000713 [Arcobacteraceae bacterium]|jgi:hypothetical protein